MLLVDVGASLLEVVDGLGDVGGAPGDDGVRYEGEAFALNVLVVGLAASDLALVSKEDESSKGVE